MKRDYDKIINIIYKGSNRKEKISIEQRAGQFAPFSALQGYDNEIENTRKKVEEEFK